MNLEVFQMNIKSTSFSKDVIILIISVEKIDVESIAKYNSFLLVLLTTLKAYCWTRIFCRDARK